MVRTMVTTDNYFYCDLSNSSSKLSTHNQGTFTCSKHGFSCTCAVILGGGTWQMILSSSKPTSVYFKSLSIICFELTTSVKFDLLVVQEYKKKEKTASDFRKEFMSALEVCLLKCSLQSCWLHRHLPCIISAAFTLL